MYFCGVETTQALGRSSKWQKKNLTYRVTGELPGIQPQTWHKAAAIAWARLEKVCGIRASKTENGNADIVMTTGRVDGRKGTLAWSELPNGSGRQLTQKYDTGEHWGVFDTGRGGGRIDLTRVICHELGHALGLSHITHTKALLNPSYSDVTHPQPADVLELVARYGEPTGPPDVDPDENVIIQIPRGVKTITFQFPE